VEVTRAWQALTVVSADRIKRDFGSENPIPEALREKLDGAEAALQRLAEAWVLAGQAFGVAELGTFEQVEELVAKLLDDTRHVLQTRDGDD